METHNCICVKGFFCKRPVLSRSMNGFQLKWDFDGEGVGGRVDLLDIKIKMNKDEMMNNDE